MMPSSTSTQPNQRRRKTALVLAGGGITGFLYEVGVLTALDELAGRALSNDFDVYVGTSAGAVLAALLANGAHAAEIFAAMTQNEAGSPFYFESRDILRPHRLYLIHRDLIIPAHNHFRPQLAQILHQVVGERIVIVEDKNHPHQITSSSA